MIKSTFFAISGACAMCLSSMATASVIDFESGFVDNEEITETSFLSAGVRFLTINEERNLTLEVEAVGANEGDNNPQGFVRAGDPPTLDDVDPGLEDRIGNFFLRTGGDINDRDVSGEKVFRIEYLTTPADLISGEIWDIDGNLFQGTEQWLVQAFDSSDQEIGAALSEEYFDAGPDSLDGDVWEFVFTDSNITGTIEDVAYIDFSFVGTKTNGVGLAFDNFRAGTPVAPIPLPAALPLMMAGLGAFAFAARRRKHT